MDARNYVMLATADDDAVPASSKARAAAGQDAADRLGVTVAARDAVSDGVLGTFEPV